MFVLLSSVSFAVLASAFGLPDIASYGAAGIIGAMWLYERRASVKREQQLDDAHDRIMADGVKLGALITVLQENAKAITELAEKLEQLEQSRRGE